MKGKFEPKNKVKSGLALKRRYDFIS
jgi:hypothetical protein